MPNIPKIYNFTDDNTISFKINGKYSVIGRLKSGTGTITVKVSHDGTNFVDLPTAISETGDFSEVFSFSGWVELEVSSSSSPDIDLSIFQIFED